MMRFICLFILQKQVQRRRCRAVRDGGIASRPEILAAQARKFGQSPRQLHQKPTTKHLYLVVCCDTRDV